MAEPVIEIEGLRGGYGREPVLHGIDLILERGKFLVLIGPNGHGKSSILRAISGLLPRCLGNITVCGQSVVDRPVHEIARLGVVHIPQGDLLFSDMTIEENLILGGYIRPQSEIPAALDEIYTLFPKLTERRQQVISSLSGGERRMVGVGRGLMSGGDILMIDEPSLGLAPIVVDQIYNVLKQLSVSGRSIMLVEENPARIVDLADKVCLIDDGHVVLSVPGKDLMENEKLLQTYLGDQIE